MEIDKLGNVKPIIKELVVKHPRAWEYYDISAEFYDVTSIIDKKTDKIIGIQYSYLIKLIGLRDSCKIPIKDGINIKDEKNWIWGKPMPEEDRESWGKEKQTFTFPKTFVFNENFQLFSGDTISISNYTNWYQNEYNHHIDTGYVKSKKGIVRIKLPGGKWEKCEDGMSLPPDTEIMTSSEAELEVILKSSKLIIKPDSYCRIPGITDPIRYNHHMFESFFELLKGVIWAHAKKEKNSLLMKTPNAICGVRGTEFQVSCDSTKTTLEVYDGTVSFYDITEKKSVEVKKGFKSEVDGNGFPATPVSLPK